MNAPNLWRVNVKGRLKRRIQSFRRPYNNNYLKTKKTLPDSE
ncbi:hypothetical protein NEIFL0001_0822 [Neisseria flavescens SK114]|uniref:Uncharacterized protein n=1 Tax=Neisseria flavescens NRL30031/H210 TaxID=546264 RepID=C0ENY0_NEIFL|nr:hypothetical protein NEIFLAOT_01669 [Neisseria flavescens NRL30031/H210]EER57406.1 hypothetical protein NEIFL0001_0822 [Neisseria flavescens SK114]